MTELGRSGFVPGVHAARALAVSMVLAAHIVGLWTNAEQFRWFPWQLYLGGINLLRVDHQAGGHVGLLLFFLVSGYIVSQAADSDSRSAFVVKRAARLLPAMILAVAVTVGVATLGRHLSWPTLYGFDPERAYSAHTLLEAVGLGLVFGGLGVLFTLWSLSVEIYWYALLSLAIGLVKVRAVAATLLFAAVISVYGLLDATVLGGPKLTAYNYVLVMLIGRWIYLHASHRTTAGIAIAGASLVAALYGATVWWYEGVVVVPDAVQRIVALGWAVILFLFLHRFIQNGPWRPVAFIGDISYGLYLFHLPVMWLVLPVISPGGRWFEVGIAITVALTIATAWASHRFLETPIRRSARRWLARREQDQQRTRILVGSQAGQ